MAKSAQTKITLDGVLAFSKGVLGLELYDWQADCARAIDRGSAYERIKVALVAPNGSGKTTNVVGISALNWLNKFPRGRVIITSADARQIDTQLVPALRSHQARFKGWEFLSRDVRTPQGGFCVAFSTDEPGRAEGHHARPDSPLLIICDEAKSIPQNIFQAFDRCTYTVMLYISSPGPKAGAFYDAFTAFRDQWITFQIGLKDCPHISSDRIEDVIRTYGEQHPFTRSTLYGEFMDGEPGEMLVFDFKALSAALSNPPHAKISRHEYAAFCDFACGRDENVLAIRSGNKLLELVAWRETDTNATIGRFIIEFRRYGLRASQIWGDAGGAGHPMCDMLAAAGWEINRFSFGAKASNDELYVSRGAEIWCTLAARITRAEIVLINDPALIGQLSTRKMTYDARGRIKLEDKDAMRDRGLKSPDRADAVCGAFAHGVQSFATFARRKKDPWEKLEEAYEGFDREGLSTHDLGANRTELEQMGSWSG